MTMKLLKRLYNRGQKMSTRQVLSTNNLTLKLTAQQHDLKEVWRRDQKSGIDHKTLDRLKKNSNITALTLEKLCLILDCQPNDVITFVQK